MLAGYDHDHVMLIVVGFHEALGDTIALSVSTPDHLRQIGLLGDIKRDKGIVRETREDLYSVCIFYHCFLLFSCEKRFSLFAQSRKLTMPMDSHMHF